MSDNRLLTRQQLYDLVWQTPMRHLASEFGLSDVGLAKICKRHKIPRPPVGYWAKKAHGKTVRRPPLHPCNEPALATITFGGGAPSGPVANRTTSSLGSTFFDPALGRLAESEARGENPITVAASLRSPHPLVARTRDGFVAASKGKRYSRDQVLYPRKVDDLWCLEIRVGQDNINRALRIMDALIKGLERRGYKVSVIDRHCRRGTFVEALGCRFQIRLREPTVRQKHVPTEKERESLRKYRHLNLVPKWDHVLSGRLLVELQSEYGLAIRTTRDGKKQRIEDKLSEISMAILRSADDSRRQAMINAERARKRAQAERQQQEEEERCKAEERRRQEEQERVEALFAEAARWARCLQLREYLDAVRNLANDRYGSIDPNSPLDQWIRWAETIAKQFDPLIALRAEIDMSLCVHSKDNGNVTGAQAAKPR